MTEEPTFKPGDKVQMKSGGPAMIITRLDDGNAECMWMQQKGKTAAYDQKTGTFPLIALVHYRRQAMTFSKVAFRN